MIKVTALAFSIAMTSGVSQNAPPRVTAMQELTVPGDRLPAGCALSPGDSIQADGNRVRGRGLLWGLPIPTNPWTGTDRRIVASISERVHGPIMAPDGPPLTARELARFRSQLADGVEEAYAASYTQGESQVAVVYAARFSSTERPDDRQSGRRASTDPRVVRVEIGPIIALVSGDGGQCFQAVGAYLKSLSN
jgi:hypothetical protein